MDERKKNNHPWDDSVYGTGRTEPPKSHGGTVALLLILIIFLCGIITVLGVLNVRLFQKLNTRRESEQSISFATGAELPAETTALPTESIDATLGEDTPTIDLQKCPQGVENVPTEGALSLQKIYSRNIDSVVSITSTGQGATATGTGVILTEDGYIVTNCHVVENGISITAQLTDGRTLPAMLVGADSVSDLAVLHIDTTGLTPAQFGDSDSLRVGDTVVAIGDPLGVKFRGTYTDGIISGIGRDMDMEGRTMTLIQTNAALNSGNSGGPLINCYGQVIGINTMKMSNFYSSSTTVEGIGFAIPSNLVKRVADEIIKDGKVKHVALGVVIKSDTVEADGVTRGGATITKSSATGSAVVSGGPADKAGLKEGDTIVAFNGNAVNNNYSLLGYVRAAALGDKVTLTIVRDGKTMDVDVTLDQEESSVNGSSSSDSNGNSQNKQNNQNGNGQNGYGNGNGNSDGGTGDGGGFSDPFGLW